MYKDQGVRISTVRAKLKVNYIQPIQGGLVAHLNAVYDGSDENKSFAKATPGAFMSITINEGTPAFDFFEQGQDLYLDFSIAQATKGEV
jgi:hypothetical protein